MRQYACRARCCGDECGSCLSASAAAPDAHGLFGDPPPDRRPDVPFRHHAFAASSARREQQQQPNFAASRFPPAPITPQRRRRGRSGCRPRAAGAFGAGSARIPRRSPSRWRPGSRPAAPRKPPQRARRNMPTLIRSPATNRVGAAGAENPESDRRCSPGSTRSPAASSISMSTIGETVQFGALQVMPRVCYTRPPTEAAATDAFVEVTKLRCKATSAASSQAGCSLPARA